MRAPARKVYQPPVREVRSLDPPIPVRVDGLEGGDADHRVYVGDGRVRVFRAVNGSAVLVHEAAVTSCAFTGRGSWRIVTADGQELQVSRKPPKPGCSCRSPLARINRKTLRGLV